MKATADVVVVDAPPLLVAEDARILSAKLESLLVVIGPSDARRPVLQSLARALSSSRTALLGVVLAGNDDHAELSAEVVDFRRNDSSNGRSRSLLGSLQLPWPADVVGRRVANSSSNGTSQEQPLPRRSGRSQRRKPKQPERTSGRSDST
jgi:hypothetical protein